MNEKFSILHEAKLSAVLKILTLSLTLTLTLKILTFDFDCTMNEKFSILHEAKLSAVLKILSSLYSKRVRVFENKTLTTVSNP